jgi:phosphoribosylcarboxyaminoimidazole (NCAIR) mutase
MGGGAGAPRTDAAMDRFVDHSRPDDVFVQAADPAAAGKAATLPQVADSNRFRAPDPVPRDSTRVAF